MKKIYLIRHAQSESNAGLAIRPNHLIALTQAGHRQAAILADWLYDHIPTPDQIFVSTYIRTHQTAQPYLQKLTKTTPPTQLDALREFNYLDYEHIKDLTLPQIISMADQFWAQADTSHTDSPTTDSFINLVTRVQTVREVLSRLPNGNYVVFTHGMWLGMLMWQLMHSDSPRLYDMVGFRQFELSARPKNCEVFVLMADDKHQGLSKVRVLYDD